MSLAGATGRFDSEEALDLVKSWAWGEISAASVQKRAQRALRDQQRLLTSRGINTGHASRSLAALAALGSAGRRPNNIKRDLQDWLGDFGIPHE
eukprot:1140031-Pyramimonas_sp.AAC.1